MSNNHQRGLQVLFLSADTGGGHRASAESLAAQFQLQFPGSTYTLLNVLSDAGLYHDMEQRYKTFSANPVQWKVLYYFSNMPAIDFVTTTQMKMAEEPKIREKIKSHAPDVVVSVHPLMNNVPYISCKKISEETGKAIPFFTVVTDLGGGHCQWFCNQVEKIFVASEQIKSLAKTRGKIPEDKFVDAGLPIRHDFAVEAKKLGDRWSEQGKEYQLTMRTNLGLEMKERKTVLVMGGGEGVGSLSNIVNALYAQFVVEGIDANILVVCGRNESLQQELKDRDWDLVIHQYHDDQLKRARTAQMLSPVCFDKGNGPIIPAISSGCFEGAVTKNIRRILSNTSMKVDSAVSPMNLHQMNLNEEDDAEPEMNETPPSSPTPALDDSTNNSTLPLAAQPIQPGKVKVIGLGFVTNMAEYMIAADVLVTKAGPGTIAEAASLSLPVMLTSFLPGQEEGNVDFVVEGGFGSFVSDATPHLAAEEVCSWCQTEETLRDLSKRAKEHGKPDAAAEIVKHIGETTMEWLQKQPPSSTSSPTKEEEENVSTTKTTLPSVLVF